MPQASHALAYWMHKNVRGGNGSKSITIHQGTQQTICHDGSLQPRFRGAQSKGDKKARACLKIHSRHLHAPLRGIFGPNSLNAAHYAAFIWPKSLTKCDEHLKESNFQTRSEKDKAYWVIFSTSILPQIYFKLGKKYTKVWEGLKEFWFSVISKMP